MPCNCENIDINSIRAAPRQLLWQRLAEIVQNISCTHTNSDGHYSPSQYWYDLDRTDRRSVSTGMSVGLQGNTIIITLTYA